MNLIRLSCLGGSLSIAPNLVGAWGNTRGSIVRLSEEVKATLKAGLIARSRYIWSQSNTTRRRGFFLAEIGLKTGHALDAMATELNILLISANGAILHEDHEAAIVSLTTIAERVFAIHPFTPDNWRTILRCWLIGEPLANAAEGQEAETLQFVEGGLVFRLPWAMEAIRVRGIANNDVIGDLGLQPDDFALALAVAAVETGTLNRASSILIQAGFTSRLAAIKAVNDTDASFFNAFELHLCPGSEAAIALSALSDWPTSETKLIWSALLKALSNKK